jgi:hypothetical protein
MSGPAPGDGPVLRRVRRGHRAAAAILLNTVVLLLLLQGALATFFWLKDRRGPVIDMYDTIPDDRMAELFPHHSRQEVASIWVHAVLPLAYQPFTEFQERPRSSAFVNVDEAGFRRIDHQGPWPPDPGRTNVFVFGGSTTFGYGVADEDTIPSRLQPLLQSRAADVRVYNFARGYYYSTQERILFEQLLAAGHVPAVAIFVDGLNDFCFDRNESSVSPRLAAALEAGTRVSFVDWLSSTPLGRAVAFVQNRLPRAVDATGGTSSTELSDDDIRRIIGRYLENKRLIEAASSAHGVTPIFVWQPVPMYRYDPQFHLFAGRGFFGVTRVRHGYEVMADVVRDRPIDGHFLWLADVQEHSRDPLYVDIVHYAPPFAARLASLIDEQIGELVVQADARRGR